jgi:hypothetical protein
MFYRRAARKRSLVFFGNDGCNIDRNWKIGQKKGAPATLTALRADFYFRTNFLPRLRYIIGFSQFAQIFAGKLHLAYFLISPVFFIF